MAAEYIDDTEIGSGVYPTKIPGFEDPADIQEALRLYHYGSSIIPSVNELGIANGINTKSIAGYLKSLSDADATHAADTTNVHGIINTAQLATTSYVIDAINGVTGDYSTLAGTGLDWNPGLERFEVEPYIANIGTVIEKTSSFSLTSAYVGNTILLSTSSAIVLTVPANSDLALPVGYKVDLIEYGSGTTTFTPGSGVTINSKNSQMYIDSQFGKATLIKVGTNSWVAYGDIYEGASTPTPAPTPAPPAPTPAPPAFGPFFSSNF
jgi:hypothetical protein